MGLAGEVVKAGMRERLRRMEKEVEHFLFRHQVLHAQLRASLQALDAILTHGHSGEQMARDAMVEVRRLEDEWQAKQAQK